MSRNTVIRATSEVEEGIDPGERQRATGGGDKPAVDGVAFMIKLVSNDDAEDMDQVFDAGFLRYEIKGPVAHDGPRYLSLVR